MLWIHALLFVLIVLLIIYLFNNLWCSSQYSEYKGVVVLDIDVTLTQSDKNIRRKIVEIARQHNYDVYVNTMRHPDYCIRKITTELGIPLSKHYCRLSMDTLYSKKKNMDSIYDIVKCDKKNIILFDDLMQTVDYVKKHGYSAIYTPNGIQQTHIDMFLKMV